MALHGWRDGMLNIHLIGNTEKMPPVYNDNTTYHILTIRKTYIKTIRNVILINEQAISEEKNEYKMWLFYDLLDVVLEEVLNMI